MHCSAGVVCMTSGYTAHLCSRGPFSPKQLWIVTGGLARMSVGFHKERWTNIGNCDLHARTSLTFEICVCTIGPQLVTKGNPTFLGRGDLKYVILQVTTSNTA